MNILSAYVATLSIVTYRWLHTAKQLPPPIAYFGATAIFGGIGIIGKSEEAQKFAGVLAWAIVLGALSAPATQISAVKGVFGTPPDVTVPTPNPFGTVIQQGGNGKPQINQNFPIH